MQRLVEDLVGDPYVLSNGESKHTHRFNYSNCIEFFNWCRLPKELIIQVDKVVHGEHRNYPAVN